MKIALENDAMPEPWSRGARGLAWQVKLDARREPAVIARWIIEAAWAHPVWHSYLLTLIHLRPGARLPVAMLYAPDATHEFSLFALDPAHPRAPAVLGQGTLHYLTPLNFAAQMAMPSADAARARMEATIDLILAGELNPDTDALRQWIALFGDNMIKPEQRRR
jgi:hypothetical protein